MPKSKRNRIVTLSKTRSKGHELKGALLQEVRDCCDKYAHLFVFNIDNMRNAKLKDLRTHWKDSRFFFGKNRVMQLALGRSDSDEYRTGLRFVSEELKGSVGLFFSNGDKTSVVEWFQDFQEKDHARSGFVATEEVVCQQGPLSQFTHTMEPQLRKLGLPTALTKGAVTLLEDHTVCKDGDELTPEQVRILKLLDVKMASFKVNLLCVWSKDGSFERLDTSESTAQKDCAVGL
ncbi:mRNA turnover protein 4 homolog [Halichondria panicea]|uniref:mRNA turnover protein 4 homolog n=1 Tax=Halichondria panicea TaxID=6063 RepID=UPI00312BA80B